MKKLAYISYEPLLAVDYPIVRELNKYYKLRWVVIFKPDVTQKFTIDDIVKYSAQNNILVKVYKMTTRYRSLKHLIKSLEYTLDLREFNSDIYYFQTFSDPYLPVFVKLFLDPRKIIIAIHDVVNHKRDNSFFRRLAKAFYINNFNNFHIYSENQKAIFLNQHPRKNIFMSRLCLSDYGPARNYKKNNKINFLFFGTILHYKGLDYLIDAANLLANDSSDFIVTVAGYSTNFSQYESQIKNPDTFDLRIRIIPNNEVADLFVNASYLVLPYRDVTQSGPLKIAYNYNIPVIASDLPGFREYLTHGYSGYLFEPNNFISLYEVMKTALNLPAKDNANMKKNLKEFVEGELSLEKIISQYRDFFDNL
jgi:glycosyltransferase involved in cell wall biosynthesis